MITSPQNEKLKLIRKLSDRRHRVREAAFLTEGEDLLEAGLAAGAEPRFVLCAAGSDLQGEEVEPSLLDSASGLGSGTRAIAVWPLHWSGSVGPSCIFLHAVADPGNVGAIVRTVHALIAATVVIGPGCADPFSPKSVRASMGSIFGQRLARGDLEQTPRPRTALVAHGGEQLDGLSPVGTICLGAEREGLPPALLGQCERRVTIALRSGAAESLNVAAAAAIACEQIAAAARGALAPKAVSPEWLSSPAMAEAEPDA